MKRLIWIAYMMICQRENQVNSQRKMTLRWKAARTGKSDSGAVVSWFRSLHVYAETLGKRGCWTGNDSRTVGRILWVSGCSVWAITEEIEFVPLFLTLICGVTDPSQEILDDGASTETSFKSLAGTSAGIGDCQIPLPYVAAVMVLSSMLISKSVTGTFGKLVSKGSHCAIESSL